MHTLSTALKYYYYYKYCFLDEFHHNIDNIIVKYDRIGFRNLGVDLDELVRFRLK
jgi:hypothetical protein